MLGYEWVIINHDLLSWIYAAIIVLACCVIFWKAEKIFSISLHQGIRYFRNAFFFIGIAFFSRYFVGEFLGVCTMIFIFKFFMILAGFTLLYSLVWKNFEILGKESYSSIFNIRMLIFSVMALIIVILDYLWVTHVFMFSSQILIFLIASIISSYNYGCCKTKKDSFLSFYLVAMIMSLFAWVLNFMLELYFGWHQGVLMAVYGLNLLVFVLFLYGVIKFT